MNWYPARVGRLHEWGEKPLAGYGLMLGLWDYAFDIGGLPNDRKKVAALTGYTEKQMEMCWEPFVAACNVMENGRLIPTEIINAQERMRQTSDRLREAGRKGGSARKLTSHSNRINDLQEAKLTSFNENGFSQDVEQEYGEQSNRINNLEEAELPMAVNGGVVVFADFGEKTAKSLGKVPEKFGTDSNRINNLQEANRKQHDKNIHEENNTKKEHANKKKVKRDISDPPANGDSTPALICEVFDHYKDILNHPKSKLDNKRKNIIRARLKEGFAVTELKAAISGCSVSDFHMGRTPKNQTVFDDIGLILRDAAHIERFTAYLSKGKENVMCLTCCDKKKISSFNDCGDVIGEEDCPACQWLNGSIGVKFVALISGNLPGLSVNPESIAATKQAGKWIDERLKGESGTTLSREQWRDAGYTIAGFKQFMTENNMRLIPKPKPETIGKLWPDFMKWTASEKQ